jgi:SAM-dependent methyltransferase
VKSGIERGHQRDGMRLWGHRNAALYGTWAQLLAAFGYRRMVREAVSLLPHDGIVADIGCGTGEATRILSRARPRLHVVSCDLAPEMVRRAGGLPPNDPLAADIEALPFRTLACHAVLCLGVLGHLIETRRAIEELARILRPGGTLMLWTRTPCPVSRLVAVAFECANPGVAFILHPVDRVVRELHGSGFGVLEERRIAGGTYWRCQRRAG